MKRQVAATVVSLALGGGLAHGCRLALPAGPLPLTATSTAYTVRGDYSLVNLDRVDGLAAHGGRLVLKGVPADLVVDLPASADPERPMRHWALVTDAHVGGRRLVTFTHSELVEDVSIQLPDGEAPLRFAAFASRGGADEVLVFATGDRASGTRSLFGHLIIHPK